MDKKTKNLAHPSKSDELEIRIINLIKEELESTKWASESFREVRGMLVNYFLSSVKSLDKPDKIHEDTQKLLRNISYLMKSKIISGEEYLSKIGNSPVIIASNHLGSYKLTELNPKEFGWDMDTDVIHPFPMFYASIYPVAEKLKFNLYDAAWTFENPIGEIQKAAGYIPVAQGRGVFDQVLEASREAMKNYQNGAFVVFPEGGTSGKRNNGGPYDLIPFKTGVFAIAAELDVPVIPVAQYFNPKTGFELGVLEPVYVSKGVSREDLARTASEVQGKMQNWLNSRYN